MQRKLNLLFLITLLFFILNGCKKKDVIDSNIPNPIVNDLVQVNASVSGIVLDESNLPISNAIVTSGASSTTTNNYGMFNFNNISLSKENGSISVVKVGYFKGIRSFKTSAGRNHSVRIQLLEKVLSSTINSATGGVVNSNGGASIAFPAACIANSDGSVYSGTVKVFSRWIDPTAANFSFIIPGDLRGISTNGSENILETYGMVGAELEDLNGNHLKIISGKTATINFPIPSILTGSAPNTILLWHFEDISARWKENGIAIKEGASYIAKVDNFSFWSCDVPNSNFINIDFTLVNNSSTVPFIFTNTRIKKVSSGSYSYCITNNAGFFSGLVPKNEELILEVISCGTVIYSQNIGPYISNTSIGDVNVNIPANLYFNFSGKLLNCNGTGVANGYLSFYGIGVNSATANINDNGNFSFSILNCTNTLLYNFVGYDNTSGQQSNLISGQANNSNVNLGNITVCGSSTDEIYVAGSKTYFINTNSYRPATIWRNGIGANLPINSDAAQANAVYVSGLDVYVAGSDAVPLSYTRSIAKLWKNGVSTNLSNGSLDAAAYSVFISGTDVYVAGKEGTFAKVWKNGIGINLTNGSQYAEANSVYVQGADVYVAGYEGMNSGVRIAKLWKNGVAVDLSNGTTEAIAYSIFVSDNDVYVGGFERNASGIEVAKLWKNNIGTNLTDGTKNAAIKSLFIDGANVYGAGYEQTAVQAPSRAKFWKNGVGTFLNSDTDNTPGMGSSYAKSIFVKGTDIYVVGDGDQYTTITNGNNTKARMWKNGVVTYLSDGSNNAFANGIFVK